MAQLVKFALALSIIAAPVGLFAQRSGQEPRVSPPAGQGSEHSRKPVSVPEPSTLLLMAAAGALAARKLWQKRQ